MKRVYKLTCKKENGELLDYLTKDILVARQWHRITREFPSYFQTNTVYCNWTDIWRIKRNFRQFSWLMVEKKGGRR